MLRLVMRVVVVLILASAAWLQFDVDSAGVGFGVVVQAELATNLLHPWLDFLYMARGMIALAYNTVEMRLACLLCVANALFENFLCLSPRSVSQTRQPTS